MSGASIHVSRARTGWWALGGLLLLVVAFVFYSFVGTFVFGVFIYYATRPIYSRIRRRVRPPSIAAAVSLLLIALPVILLLSYTIAIAIQELSNLSQQTDLGRLEALILPYLNLADVPLNPEQLLSGDNVDAVSQLATSAGRYLGVLGTAALHLFVMIAIAFYLLRDDHRLSRWARRRFGDDAGVVEAYLDAIDRDYHQIFFGNILNAVITGTIGALIYSLLDVFSPVGIAIPYPTLLGLLAGVASLIPIVGMKLVYFPATAYLAAVALLADDPGILWFPAAFFILSFVVVDSIPDLVLRPYVSGRSLHVGMVMFAYILGPLMFGWYGIFLGPMLLVLIVHFTRTVLPELIAGEPVRPVAVDPTYLTEPQPEPTDSESSASGDADPEV